MTAPLDVPEAATQVVAPVGGTGAVAGRSPWRITWTRLRRDRVALAELAGPDDGSAGHRVACHFPENAPT